MQDEQNIPYEDDYAYEMPDHAGKTIRRLWRSVSDQHGRLAVVLVSVAFYTLLSIYAPFYSVRIVDFLWNGIRSAHAQGTVFRVSWEQGGREIAVLLAVYTATAGLYTLQSFLMSSFAERLSLRLRTEISEKINRLPLVYFDNHKTGEVMSRAVNDLDKMSEALQTGLLRLFTAAGMVTGSLVVMFQMQVWLTLIFLFFMGLALLSTKLFAAKTLQLAARRQQCVSNVTARVEEAYSGRVIIKAFGREQNSSREIHRATEELAEVSRKADFLVNAINPAIRLVNRLGQVLIAVTAGKLLIDGALSVGTFQAFFQYVNQSAEPLTEGAYMVNSMQSALASVERIYALLDEPEIGAEPETAALERRLFVICADRAHGRKSRVSQREVRLHAGAGADEGYQLYRPSGPEDCGGGQHRSGKDHVDQPAYAVLRGGWRNDPAGRRGHENHVQVLAAQPFRHGFAGHLAF